MSQPERVKPVYAALYVFAGWMIGWTVVLLALGTLR